MTLFLSSLLSSQSVCSKTVNVEIKQILVWGLRLVEVHVTPHSQVCPTSLTHKGVLKTSCLPLSWAPCSNACITFWGATLQITSWKWSSYCIVDLCRFWLCLEHSFRGRWAASQARGYENKLSRVGEGQGLVYFILHWGIVTCPNRTALLVSVPSSQWMVFLCLFSWLAFTIYEMKLLLMWGHGCIFVLHKLSLLGSLKKQ